MQKVVAYARVSKDKTGQAHSVTAQLAEMRAYAAEEGLEIVAECRDDSISAYNGADRPGYREMLDYVRSGRVGGVLVWHPDRAWRGKIAEVEAFIDLARKHNVRHLHMVMGGRINLMSAQGVKSLIAAANDARFESAHKGERVSLARERQAREGIHCGSRPYGFGPEVYEVRKWDKAAEQYVTVPTALPVRDTARVVPEEAEEVRRWARDLLAGVSVRQVVADANRRGMRTPMDRPWTTRRVRDVLTSHRMTGASTRKGEVVNEHAFEQIITEDQRAALERLFSDPSRKTSPGNRPRWLGSLILKCGTCNNGNVMVARFNTPSKDGSSTRVYSCKERNHNKRPVHLLDPYIEKVMVGRLSRPDAIDLIALPTKKVDVAALHEEELALRERRDALAVAFAEGDIDRQQLAAGTEHIDRRVSEIRSQLAEVTMESPLSAVVGQPDVWDAWDALPIGRKRAIVRELADITVLPPKRGPIRLEVGTPEWAEQVPGWVKIEWKQ